MTDEGASPGTSKTIIPTVESNEFLSEWLNNKARSNCQASYSMRPKAITSTWWVVQVTKG